MPLKNKNRRARELVASLGRESMKMIRDEHIQGDYVRLMFVSVVKCQ